MKSSATIAVVLFAVFCFADAKYSNSQNYGSAQARRFSSTAISNRYTTNQYRNQVNRGYGRVGVAGVNARTFGNAFSSVSSGAKPFKGLNRGPSVSPYLALSGSLNGVSDYYNIVKPQQDFQRERRQQEITNARTEQMLVAQQHRLNQMAARPPFDIQGDENLAPTGHSTAYMAIEAYGNTGRYFTPVVGLEKRR